MCNDVFEVCPLCEHEVILEKARLKTPHKCPHCGKYIMPCSLCYDCGKGCDGCNWEKLNRTTGEIE